MNPSDREILGLNELCGALVDGHPTAAQRARLEALLRESEAARLFYVRALGQSASLQTYASEMHTDAPGRPAARGRLLRTARAPMAWLALAAALVLGFLGWSKIQHAGGEQQAGRGEFVARLSGAKDATWSRGADVFAPGGYLRKGQRIDLESGYAEITFDSGARIMLEGAASLDVGSAWDATLRRGTLKADVPPQAIGFRILNRFVEVIDLGTEFTVIADADRGAEVLVNKGEVEAVPRAGGDGEAMLLREREARRFADSGITDVADRVRKFALFDAPLVFERMESSARFAHWSFDEGQGAARATGSWAEGAGAMLQLLGPNAGGETSSRDAGRRNRALVFDGQRYASAEVAGLSSAMPRTIAFWVKISEDAQPLDTWMVAWGSQLPKLGRRPVHIGWNRRPSDGALGALRTDFGGGHAIGTTSLRDGQWHHVAVFFHPGEEPSSPVQVKQYVDGRLESSTIVRGTLSARAGTGDALIQDTVWLGYRLTGNRQEGRRFRGSIDELFIVDRALQPHEVVALIQDNRLPAAGLAAHP